jgi:hypothetical protein
VGKYARRNLPGLENTTFIVVIRRVPTGNNDQASRNHLHASYIAVRHQEELIDIVEESCGLKQPNSLNAIYPCDMM